MTEHLTEEDAQQILTDYEKASRYTFGVGVRKVILPIIIYACERIYKECEK